MVAGDTAVGTVTVAMLFTDIEGSTRMLQQLGAEYPAMLTEHHKLMRAAFAAHRGDEQSTEGDSFFVTFAAASDAVAAALDAQRVIAAHAWSEGAAPRVRMGIHAGEIQTVAGTIIGLSVHEGARIGAAAHGGQVLVSALAAELAGPLPEKASWHDLGHHVLKDIGEPVQLLQLTHTDLPIDFPPPRSQGASRNNLPAQASTFVGRDGEVVEVTELLGATRLLTLTGTGGAGKSRLALRVASEQGIEFPDGIWFVELAPITDAAPVVIAQQIAAAIGQPESSAADIAGAMGARRLLLVLDNCEHVVAAVGDVVADVLRRCPNVTVLATSREPLNIRGEVAWRVPSLDDEDAVALLVERARAVNPRFEVTNTNRDVLGAICRQLDAIPLALELAAARLTSLTPEQLASRLDQRFRLLAGGARGTTSRQQTLQATVDWSYDLLDERAQTVLRRLGVFVGGFALEAAEQVCATDDIDTVDVFDLVDQLVSKSLVTAEASDGAIRYRLLETIRQYALDRLTDAGEVSSGREAHVTWMGQLASEAEDALWSGGQEAEWFDRLDDEEANLRAAFDGALETGRLAEATTMVFGIFMWVLARGRPHDALVLATRLLETDLGPADRAVASYAEFLYLTNARDSAPDDLYERLRRDVDVPLPGVRAWIAPVATATAAVYGSADDDLVLCNSAVELTTSAPAMVVVMAQQMLAFAHQHKGDLVAAAAAFHAGLTIARERASDPAICRLATGLMGIAYEQGDVDRAWRYAEEVVAAARSTGDATFALSGTQSLAVIAARRGDLGKARALLTGVLDIVTERSLPIAVARHYQWLAWFAVLDGDAPTADVHAAQALALLRPEDPETATVLFIAGEAARLMGDPVRAWDLLVRAGETRADHTTLLTIVEGLGGVRADIGDAVGAARLMGAAAAPRAAIDTGPQSASEPAQRRIATIVDCARAALDADTFAAAWAEGEGMDLDAAFAAAMAMDAPS